MTIGDRIETRRKAIGIRSQSALARQAQMGQSTLSGIIRKDYRWSPFLPRLARELRTTVDYLVGDTDDPDANAPFPPPSPSTQHVLMAVAMPPERALTAMFTALLNSLDRSKSVVEQAQLLAKRLPIAMSQLRDLLPEHPAPQEADPDVTAGPATRPTPERVSTR